MKKPGARSGFSIVELSVVLAIVGLLIGAVLSGQSMIRAAQVKSVVTDYLRYENAVGQFKGRFKALPGDMANATLVWGALPSCPTSTATVATGTATCNGNGDGALTNPAGAYEFELFWQHLANAGLIEGFYTGGNNVQTRGVTVPASKVPMAYFIARYGLAYTSASATTTYYAGSANWYAGDYGKDFLYFRSYNIGNNITPPEAMSIDTKMDDGMPGTGIIVAYKGTTTNPCTTGVNISPPADAGTGYLLTSNKKDCYLLYVRAF